MKKLPVLVVTALCASSALAASDGFNRSSLGKNWVTTQGSLTIENDKLQGSSGALGYDKKSAGDMGASVAVYLNGTDVAYGALALGDVAGGSNAFVKIQSQDADGRFEYAAFYVGNNGEGEFFPLNKPVSSPATIFAWSCGTYGFLKIKSSSGSQKYYYDYGSSFDPGAGLGTGGKISLDNYKSGAASCTGSFAGAMEIRASSARDLSK